MIVYLNGSYLPSHDARISPFDRGFLMADGIYEVTSIMGGKLVDYDAHMMRLERSMKALGLSLPCTVEALLPIHRELIARNEIQEGGVYLQLTRGNPEGRDFLWPDPASVAPTLFLYAFSKPIIKSALAERGARIKTVDDLRWARRDIKTVQLLYPSMVKSQAKAEGYDDVWLTEDGFVTEGSSSNVHLLSDGRLITRPLSTEILHGITRASLLSYTAEASVEIDERPFTVAEAQASAEAFATSSTGLVQPIVEIDGKTIGDGRPGPVTQRLRSIYIEESKKRAI